MEEPFITIEPNSDRPDELWWIRLPPAMPPHPSVEEEYRAYASKAGFVPTMMLALANDPEAFLALRAFTKLVLDPKRHELTEAEKELIALVVSVENRCSLCIMSHANLLRGLTGDAYNVGLIEANYRHTRLSVRE